MRAALPYLALLLVGCGATSRNQIGVENDPPLSAAGGAGGVDGVGAPPVDVMSCTPPAPGLVRLTFDEAIESARALLGDGLAAEMGTELGDRPALSFPPLASPSEGTSFTDQTWEAADRIARVAGRYVREHFDVTGCDNDDFECVRAYVSTLGERAFRRPLDAEEQSALLRPVELAEALGVDATFGAEYGVYATLQSPHFLYRREFGDAASDLLDGEQRLNDYELASTLAFFLNGGPPDDALLESAAAGKLAQGGDLEAHVDRLLAAPSTRRHLERLLSARLRFATIETIVLDPAVQPISSAPSLRPAMRTELEALLQDSLWNGGVGGLLTDRQARINADLASIYGISFPPNGQKPDADGFVEAELPRTRAGILTRAGWALLGSRPDRTSIVLRGVQVMNLLCEPGPEFPELDPNVRVPPELSEASEREQATYRMTEAACATCHTAIDPPGIALDDLDEVGRFRTTDAAGRPIDARATLPEFAGGAEVNGALELSQAIPEDALARCLSQAFLIYAGNTLKGGASCEEDVLATERAMSGDQSFTNVIKQIALSRSFRLRKP